MTAGEYEAMVRQYEKLVYTVCYQLVRDVHTAEDLAQDAFLSAWLHRDDCRPDARKAWLCRIAVNKAKDYLKSAAGDGRRNAASVLRHSPRTGTACRRPGRRPACAGKHPHHGRPVPGCVHRLFCSGAPGCSNRASAEPARTHRTHTDLPCARTSAFTAGNRMSRVVY